MLSLFFRNTYYFLRHLTPGPNCRKHKIYAYFITQFLYSRLLGILFWENTYFFLLNCAEIFGVTQVEIKGLLYFFEFFNLSRLYLIPRSSPILPKFYRVPNNSTGTLLKLIKSGYFIQKLLNVRNRHFSAVENTSAITDYIGLHKRIATIVLLLFILNKIWINKLACKFNEENGDKMDLYGRKLGISLTGSKCGCGA